MNELRDQVARARRRLVLEQFLARSRVVPVRRARRGGRRDRRAAR